MIPYSGTTLTFETVCILSRRRQWHPTPVLLPGKSQHQGLFKEAPVQIRWPKYWSFSFSISPYKVYSGLISFDIDWFDLLALQERNSVWDQWQDLITQSFLGNKVLLKCKRDRQIFWHSHLKGAERVAILLVLANCFMSVRRLLIR